MSLNRIEDMFAGFKPMLAYLVEDLVFKGKLNEAKGVVLRNDLQTSIRLDVRSQLASIDYNPNLEPEPYDTFGPLSDGDFIRLPETVKVEHISVHDDIVKLDQLFEEKYIGVDSEWRPALTKFHKTSPALFQISGKKVAFLIDFVSLKDSVELDIKLQQVFTFKESVIVGFSFGSDVE